MLFGSSAAQLTHGWVFIRCAERRKHSNYSFPEAGVHAFIQRLQQTSLSLCSVNSTGLLFSVRTLQVWTRASRSVCVHWEVEGGAIFGSPYESGSDVAPDEICLARRLRGRAVLLRGFLPASQRLRQLVSMAKNRLPLLSPCALSPTSHLPFWLNSAEKWCFILTLPVALSPLSLRKGPYVMLWAGEETDIPERQKWAWQIVQLTEMTVSLLCSCSRSDVIYFEPNIISENSWRSSEKGKYGEEWFKGIPLKSAWIIKVPHSLYTHTHGWLLFFFSGATLRVRELTKESREEKHRTAMTMCPMHAVWTEE